MNIVTSFLKKQQIYFLIVFSFLLPLWQKPATIILVFWAISGLLQVKNIKLNKAALLFLALYISYIISEFCYGTFGIKTLEMKAAFIAVPLIFATHQYTIASYQKALNYFAYGVVFSGIYCVLLAVFNSVTIADNQLLFSASVVKMAQEGFLESSIYGGNYFFGSHFSKLHQTVYFSLYLNVATLILLSNKKVKPKYKYVTVLFFGLLLFLVSNRVNMTMYLVVLTFYTIEQVRSKKTKIIALIGALSMLSFIALTHPRTKGLVKNIYANGFVLDREANTSFSTRLLTWNAASGIVKTDPLFGVGFSKGTQKLQEEYKKKRYVYPYRYQLNAHNQWLQILVDCGVVGLCVLLFQMSLFFSIKGNYTLFSKLIGVLFSVNFMFESMLNRSSGIIIYVFLGMICYYMSINQTNVLDKDA